MKLTTFFRSDKLRNSLWMIAEKLITLLGLIFITSFVARYIGVALFGQLALAIALFQIIQVAAQMGSDNVIFKRITRHPRSGMKLIRATLMQRLLIYLLLSAPLLLWQYFQADRQAFAFFLAVFVATLFSTLDVYVVYYNARLQSRYNALVNSLGLLLGFLLRYVVVWLQLAPVWLSVPIVVTTLLPLIVRHLASRQLYACPLTLRAMQRYRRYLLRAGFSLVLASLSVALYSRVSQLTLAWLAGSSAVGLFSAASTLASSWTVITAAVITSSFTAIFRCKDDLLAARQAAQLHRLILLISLFFVVSFALGGYAFLRLLYGDDYLAAWPVLMLLTVAAVFSAAGPIPNCYIVRLSGYRYLTIKTLLLVALSLPLNVVLCWQWGLYGAAISVIIVEALALTVFNYPFAQGVVWKIHCAAFTPKVARQPQ